MDNFKQASRQKLRVQTNKGLLSVEQLWDLSLGDLDTLAVSLEQAYEDSKGRSFIVKKTTKDKDLKLQFDVVLDILQTKAEEADAAKEARETKEFNTKILELIEQKKDESLKGKTIAELKRMLK